MIGFPGLQKQTNKKQVAISLDAADDDDELMLNVLRCHLTY